jgi:hypothetical protein
VDASDAADHIREAVEAERTERRAEERFRTRVAIVVWEGGVYAISAAIISTSTPGCRFCHCRKETQAAESRFVSWVDQYRRVHRGGAGPCQ